MSILVWPVAGEPESRSSDFAQCARLMANAALRVAYPSADAHVADNGTAENIRDAVNGLRLSGVSAIVVYGTPSSVLNYYIPQGCYVGVGVNCTPDCIPVTYDSGIRHWLTGYSTAFDTYNCWYATFQRYANLDACHNYGMGNVVMAVPGAVQISQTQPTGGMPLAALQETDMVGRVIMVPRTINNVLRVDTYWVNNIGDVWHKWGDPKSQGNERVGQNGSNEPTGLDASLEIAGVNLGGVTYLRGVRATDGAIWLAVQSDGGATWVGGIYR